VKEYLRNERGMVSYLLALLFIPLLVVIYVNGMVSTQAVAIANIDLQDTVERAARASAYQVTEDSEAVGQPRINTSNPDHPTAQQVFQSKLAGELGLDSSTLQPLEGSAVKSVSYVLVVYNVDNQYVSGGSELCRKYVFSGGSMHTTDMFPIGNPSTFAVTANDILLSTSGLAVTTLERPGVIALVNASMSGVGETNPGILSRWCTAKVVSSTGI